ncbi:hypothetical protein [Spirosoma flavum]|uniref:Uncharacterized protein n=1 Tax=Spirosoma flavum TaxID=2048557 RepID=A0ABW6AT65_9BACT
MPIVFPRNALDASGDFLHTAVGWQILRRSSTSYGNEQQHTNENESSHIRGKKGTNVAEPSNG